MTQPTLNQYTVTLEITVLAESEGEAFELQTQIGDHIFETFNDDDSIVAIDHLSSPVRRNKTPLDATRHQLARLDRK